MINNVIFVLTVALITAVVAGSYKSIATSTININEQAKSFQSWSKRYE